MTLIMILFNTTSFILNVFSIADVVRLGEHDYNDEEEGAFPEDFDVLDTVLYPDYKHPQAYHDIALLKLASKVTIQVSIR